MRFCMFGSELLDGGFRLVHDVLVVFIGEDGGRIADVHPADLGDLFLLWHEVIVFVPRLSVSSWVPTSEPLSPHGFLVFQVSKVTICSSRC